MGSIRCEGPRGSAVGHVTPEAAVGGPLALVEMGDIISIDIRKQTLELVGADGVPENPDEIKGILAERSRKWKGFMSEHRGVLGLFTRLAGATPKGASLLR